MIWKGKNQGVREAGPDFRARALRRLALVFLASLATACLNDAAEMSANKPQDEYTAENPGEWKAIATDHLPIVKIDTDKTEDNIEIHVPGRRFSQDHYIERIGLMHADKKTDVRSQALERDMAPGVVFSLHPLPRNTDEIKVYVKCNLHDLWTAPLSKFTN